MHSLYPSTLTIVAWLATTFTMIKWGFVAASIALFGFLHRRFRLTLRIVVVAHATNIVAGEHKRQVAPARYEAGPQIIRPICAAA